MMIKPILLRWISRYWSQGVLTAAFGVALVTVAESRPFLLPSWWLGLGVITATYVGASLALLLITHPAEWLGDKFGNGFCFLIAFAGPLALLSMASLPVYYLATRAMSIVAQGWAEQLQKVVIRPLSEWARVFSVGSLFSLSAVPYRLFPLSCCLLN